MSTDRDVVIGLEIHIELDTETKLFCGCSRRGESDEEPNSRCCPVCLGHPGSKPVLNEKAVEYALRLCMALQCHIRDELIFSRKSYFYPDMAKNYQITQYEEPLGEQGNLSLRTEEEKDVRIKRLHLEEDPAALVHPGGASKSSYVLIDYNRSGNPLCEIVTEPDLASPTEAREFMKRLIEVIKYLRVFDIDSCVIKADANVSVADTGYVRSEIKNITGFKETERALDYEVERHKQCAREGISLSQETRGWNPDKGITYSMRTKETEEDYGYILDPDLTVTDITESMVASVHAHMPELAHQKVDRFMTEWNLERTDAEVLAAEREVAELLEEVVAESGLDPVFVARWMRREFLRVLNYNKLTVDDLGFGSAHLVTLLTLLHQGRITQNVAKRIIEELVFSTFDIEDYVSRHQLEAVSDENELERICQETIDANPQAAAEVAEGKKKALNFLVGQIMRQTKGKASPQQVNEIISRIVG